MGKTDENRNRIMTLKQRWRRIKSWACWLHPKFVKTALVCIAKDEDLYIEEWVNYHRKLGFDSIFIYQNDWRTSLAGRSIVKVEMDGPLQQVPAYNHFIQNFGRHFHWVAFFDVDEFLVLKKHKTLKDFLKNYRYAESLAINWVLFGDNFQEKVEGNNYSVLKRFTKRQIGVDRHFKSIINLVTSGRTHMEVHHTPHLQQIDLNGNPVHGNFHASGDDRIAQLNHYFGKTLEEFIQKKNRGRADVNQIREMNDFDRHNFNEVEDTTARDFLYGDG